MAKSKHDQVVEILYQLSKNYKSYNKVCADHVSVSSYKRIPILSRNQRGKSEVHQYRPDLWCRYGRTNKIEVFEVWDNQSEDACVEDILFAALTPNIELLYIICFNKGQYELAKTLVKVILSSLFDEDGNLLLEPPGILRYVKLLPKNIISNNYAIKRFLQKELEF